MKITDIFPETPKELTENLEIADRADAWLKLNSTFGLLDSPYSMYLRLEETIIIMSAILESEESVITENIITPSTSYWIDAKGDIFSCEQSKHNIAALKWAIHNNVNIFYKMIKSRTVEGFRYTALNDLNWVEFSVQGTEMNIVTSEWYRKDGRHNLTKEQKESLAKILEVNNITDEEQWKYTF